MRPAPLESFWGRQPARDFVSTSSQMLGPHDLGIADVPLTLSVWFSQDALANNQTLIGITNSENNHRYVLTSLVGGGVQAVAIGLANGLCNSSNTRPASEWNHAAGVYLASNSRLVYLRGISTSNVTEVGMTGPYDVAYIGARLSTTVGNYWNGLIAWPCVWNVALTSGEIKRLAEGAPPWTIRPESIVSCPNMDNLYDPFLGASWTNSGTTLAAPPFIARGRSMIAKAPVVGGTAMPVFADHYHRMRRAG